MTSNQKKAFTLNKNNSSVNNLLQKLKTNPIINFLIKFPGNRNNKDAKLEYIGTLKFTNYTVVLKLPYGNANYAWFLHQDDAGYFKLCSQHDSEVNGIVISIKNKKFTLEYLNYNGFSSVTHYLINSNDHREVSELKTVQDNINAFLYLWEQFVIYKENNPDTCGMLYNASTFRLSYGEKIAQPIILQLLGKRFNYYTNHRFCMKKVTKWDTAIQEAELVIRYVNHGTVGDFMKAYYKLLRNPQSMNYLTKMLKEPNFQEQKISQVVSYILKNPLIKIEEKHIWKLYDMIRTVLNLPVYSPQKVANYYQGGLEMNVTMRVQGKTKRGQTNPNNNTKTIKKQKNNLNKYINHVGILPNGRIGKINNISNRGVNYTVLLTLKNNSSYVFMGDYNTVLQHIQKFIKYDKLQYLKYYQNKQGIYNHLQVKIKNVGKINNMNLYFATYNTPSVRNIPMRTITGPSFANLKNKLDRMINNRIQMNHMIVIPNSKSNSKSNSKNKNKNKMNNNYNNYNNYSKYSKYSNYSN